MEQTIEEELLPEKLERPVNSLEECNRFLKPIEEFASEYPETHFLAFEVYHRKNKPLLMLKALKKIKSNLSNAAKYHYYACKFLIKYEKNKSSYNSDVLWVIENELKKLQLFGESVEQLNQKFLNANQGKFDSLMEGAKIFYDLNPNENRDKALEMLKNFSKEDASITYKTGIDALELVSQKHYFGKSLLEEVEDLRKKLNEFLPEATIFKKPDEQANELINCIQGLSLSSFLPSVTDLTEKISSVNIR